MDNQEVDFIHIEHPTADVIGAALKRTQKLVQNGKSVHLNEALAKSTMSVECQPYLGFIVFAKAKEQLQSVLPESVSYEDFCAKAKPEAHIDALESAYLVVMS